MNRVRSKSDLPEKICVVCQRPFTWRKKWQDCWDDWGNTALPGVMRYISSGQDARTTRVS
ncbi:MAG: DUF2256 domain-containing protein [Anabaena sp. 49628_E55]|nr:DUF2256 domain-containing protein [Anabaena sp. 49628_E55]